MINPPVSVTPMPFFVFLLLFRFAAGFGFLHAEAGIGVFELCFAEWLSRLQHPPAA
jgi:hypothetical protein